MEKTRTVREGRQPGLAPADVRVPSAPLYFPVVSCPPHLASSQVLIHSRNCLQLEVPEGFFGLSLKIESCQSFLAALFSRKFLFSTDLTRF